MYNLHTMINLTAFLEFPLNSCSLATSTYVLGYVNVTAPSAPSSPACVIIACSTASYSCCCQTTYSKLMLYWLMVYSGDSGDSDMGGGDWLLESANPVLDLLSDSYSDSDFFLCKS